MPFDSQGNYYYDPNDSALGDGGGNATLPYVDIQTLGDRALDLIEGTDAKGTSKSQRQFEIGLTIASATTQHVYYYVAPASDTQGFYFVNKLDFASNVSFLNDATYAKVEFLPGVTKQTITIDVAQDSVYEHDEWYTVQLADPSSGIQLDARNASYSWWIANDDMGASISSTTSNVVEGDNGRTNYRFKVTLSEKSNVDQTIDWKIVGTGIHPTDKNDFSVTKGSVIIKKGNLSADLDISVKGDIWSEYNETFNVVLANNKTSSLVSDDTYNSAGGIITSDDGISIVTMSVIEDYLYEGQVVDVEFKLNEAQKTDQTISWRVVGSESTADDFLNNRFPNETVVIGAGKTNAKTSFTIKKDTIRESFEQLKIELFDATEGLDYSSVAGITRLIAPVSDNTITVKFSITNDYEGSGNNKLITIKADLDFNSHEGVTFNWLLSSFSSPTSVSKADFVGDKLPYGKLTVAAGKTTGTASFQIKGDMLGELNESFKILLSTTDKVIDHPSKEWEISGVIENDDGILGTKYTDDLKGTAKADFIDAKNGDDIINGGMGNDTLVGGLGRDRFVFDTALGINNVDNIIDFESTYDRIYLKATLFSALGAQVTEDELLQDFHVKAEAQDGNDYLIYDNHSGKLYFDADGNGKGQWVQIAKIVGDTGFALTNFDVTDFIII